MPATDPAPLSPPLLPANSTPHKPADLARCAHSTNSAPCLPPAKSMSTYSDDLAEWSKAAEL